MDFRTEYIEVMLANGATVHVEAIVLDSEEDVAFGQLSFEGLSDAIEGIAESIMMPLTKIKPSKLSVELGVEIGIDAGKLTALLVQGNSKANLKIKLEWESEAGTLKK